MKRLIVLFLLISSTAYPQAWKQLYSVPNKNTRFGIAVPKDVLIYEIDSSKIYRLMELRLPTDSMATAFRLNKAVAISGSSSASVDTTGWNIATKSDVPWYVASGAIKQKTSTDSVVPNYAITYANPIGYINARSATYPVTNYARIYLNGNAGSTSIYNGYNGPAEFANSSISYTQTPSAGAVTWLYGNSGYGTYKYQMDVNGLYPSIYSTAGTYNQYLGTPTGPWNYAYLKKLHVSELIAGTSSDSLLTTKDGEVKRIAAATFEPAITAGTTSQYWRGDKTWQTLPSSTPVDSIPFQRNASRGVTFLRNGTDKVAIGSAATPDSTLKVTGGVNVTGGLKVAGKVMAPTFIGGTAVGSGITYQSTTGNGTSTGIAHQFKGGNNGATTAITILNNGKIGIGTTNPLYALHVFGDAVLGSVTTLSGSAGQAAIDGSNSSGGYAGKFASTTGTAGYFSTSSSGTGIHVTSNTGYAAIFQKGNVGIGTTSPARLLHVKGRARIDTIPYSASPTLKVVAQDTTTGDIYRTTVSSGTTYSATSPMSVSGNDVHILSDTLTSWRAKMNAVAAKQDSTANPFMYKNAAGTNYIVDRYSDGAQFSLNLTDQELTVNSIITNSTGTSSDWNAKMSNPMTTNGDLIYQHAGVPTRVPVGTLNQCLRVGGDDGNGRVLTWTDQEWLTSSGNAYRSTGNIGIGTSTPMHKVVAVGGKATNLNMLNLVSSDWNKSRTSVATATDTSSVSWTFTDGGKPMMSMKSNTGTTYLANDSTGRFGFGTATPTALLEVQGNKSSSWPFYISNDRNSTKDTVMVFTTGGRVGIGTTAPANPLHVYGGVATATLESNSSETDLTYKTSDGKTWIAGVYAQGYYIQYNGESVDFIIKPTTHRLGLFTTSPSYDLSFGGNSSRTIGMERHSTTNTAGNSFTLRAGGATSGATDKLGGPLYYYSGKSTGNATGVAHQWYTYNATTSGTTDQTETAKMTMTSTGNLIIGGTAPSSTLHVVGSARVSDSLKALGKVYATNITRQDTGTYKLLWNSGTGEIKAAVNEPDHVYAYYSGAGITRASAVSNTYYPIVGALTSPEQHNFSVDGDSCLIYYTGATGHVKHYISITFAGTSNEDIEFDLYNLNDAAEVPTSQLCTATGTGNRQNITLVCYDINATKNDRYELRLRNTTATNNVIVYRIMWWGESTHN